MIDHDTMMGIVATARARATLIQQTTLTVSHQRVPTMMKRWRRFVSCDKSSLPSDPYLRGVSWSWRLVPCPSFSMEAWGVSE